MCRKRIFQTVFIELLLIVFEQDYGIISLRSFWFPCTDFKEFFFLSSEKFDKNSSSLLLFVAVKDETQIFNLFRMVVLHKFFHLHYSMWQVEILLSLEE